MIRSSATGTSDTFSPPTAMSSVSRQSHQNTRTTSSRPHSADVNHLGFRSSMKKKKKKTTAETMAGKTGGADAGDHHQTIAPPRACLCPSTPQQGAPASLLTPAYTNTQTYQPRLDPQWFQQPAPEFNTSRRLPLISPSPMPFPMGPPSRTQPNLFYAPNSIDDTNRRNGDLEGMDQQCSPSQVVKLQSIGGLFASFSHDDLSLSRPVSPGVVEGAAFEVDQSR